MLQCHHLIAQQPKRPTRTAFRRSTTRQCNQVSLRFAIDLTLEHPRARLGAECLFEPVFHKPLTSSLDACSPTSQRLDNLGIGFCRAACRLIGQQQDPRPNKFLRSRLAHAHQLPQIVPLRLRQRNPVTLLHDTLLTFWPSMKPRQENTIHQLASDRALGEEPCPSLDTIAWPGTTGWSLR